MTRLIWMFAIVLALFGAGGEASPTQAAGNLIDPSEHCDKDPISGIGHCARSTRRTESLADESFKPSRCLPCCAPANPLGHHVRMALAPLRAIPPDSPVSLHTLLTV